ncbi:MAG: DUF5696 domain-containing protein [Lentisphaerota bacterium]
MKLKNDLLVVDINDLNLHVSVTDQRNGANWQTPGPGISLCTYMVPEECNHWYDSDSTRGTTDWLGNPIKDCEICICGHNPTSVEYHVNFCTIELSFNVRFELENMRLTVTIPPESWDYRGELLYEVQSLDLLPQFGARPRGAEGCLVLPHGGGTLRYFKDRPERGGSMYDALRRGHRGDYARSHGTGIPDPVAHQTYASPVYGVNSQWRDMIWFPLWGVVSGNAGFAAYVPFNHGDADTAIIVTANYGVEQLCAVHARFHYRQHPRDQRVDEPRRLVFDFLEGQVPDYSDIARVYRNYLLNEVAVPALRQKAETSPEVAYQAGAYMFCPMMGLKRFKWYANPYADGSGPLDIYLTYDDLITEMRRSKEAGVGHAVVQMVGFNRDGHDGSYPDIFPLEPKVGGEDGFSRCAKSMRELDYRSSVHLNLRCYSRNSQNFRYETVMRDRDGGPVVNQTGPEGEDFNACPWAAAAPFIQDILPRLKALGADGGVYFDFMLGVLFRCYQTRHCHGVTRRDYMNGVLKFFEQAKHIFGSVRAENAIAPALSITDASHTIIHPRRGESYLADSELRQRGLFDESVAMMVVVYHGLVFYYNEPITLGERDYWDMVLYNLSIGAGPRDELRGSSPQFDRLRALEYKLFCEQLKWLRFEFIDRIERCGQVVRTTYSDGTVTLVNFGREPATLDGCTLSGRGFQINPGSPGGKTIAMGEDILLNDLPPAPVPDGNRCVGAPLRGAADVAARVHEFTVAERKPNPVTG